MHVPQAVVDKFPPAFAEAVVFDSSGVKHHSVRYDLNDEGERRAVGERITDVLRQGYEVVTKPCKGRGRK